MAAIGLLFVDDGSAQDGDDAGGDDPAPDPQERQGPLKMQAFGVGSDNVIGTDGRDQLELGDGDDIADGGAADDRLFGEEGNDQIWGGTGDDRIFLGEGNDFNYSVENPQAEQVAGNDFIRGGDGEDWIVDFLGSNTIYGDLGADIVDGVDGNGEAESPDALYGGFGKDIIAGDNGDLMSGGADMDAFFVVLNAGPVEPAVITDYEKGEGLFVTVPLAFQNQDAELVQSGGGLDLLLGGEVILRVEGVSDPDDVDLFFSAMDVADQTITPGQLVLGTQGDDQVSTGNGDDAVFAGRGDDDISTGNGEDYISLRTSFPFAPEGALGWGDNTVNAGSGDDRVLGGLGDDHVQGGKGNDLIEGGGGADVLAGGDGNDFIDAFDVDNPAADRLFGGQGDDRMFVNDGDVVTGGSGRDVIDIEEFQPGDAAVRVTDFNPAQDTLRVAVDGGDTAITAEASGQDTRIFVGNREVAILEGLRPSQIPARAIQVSRYA
ncbi:calcium-binding protein [Yoonia sp. R2331]|uniref:calcium-binding protein n=1 Tax=Yoonia sp. R2331 TaxID=3237238 RepID=UPI0034E5B6B3